MKKLTEKEAWLLLSRVSGIGPRRCLKLLKRFGKVENIFKASRKEIEECLGEGEVVENILKAEVETIEEDLEIIERLKIELISLTCKFYPTNLKFIFDPPFLLYVRGMLLPRDEDAIAIVGTRRATLYGRMTARSLARKLSSWGVTIISGMARGIDTEAHWGALEGGGRTIAVLGSGVDIIYPPENRNLAEKIMERGALVSEFPPGTPPESLNFPARNRIISGLARGVVVVEAPLRSGALITVDFALEQGREVFAVPGNIDRPKSFGTNLLIKEGAKLVQSPEDIVEEIKFKWVRKEKEKEKEETLSPPERKIIELIKEAPSHIDLICRKTGLSLGEVSFILTNLELKGRVRELPGKIFALR